MDAMGKTAGQKHIPKEMKDLHKSHKFTHQSRFLEYKRDQLPESFSVLLCAFRLKRNTGETYLSVLSQTCSALTRLREYKLSVKTCL